MPQHRLECVCLAGLTAVLVGGSMLAQNSAPSQARDTQAPSADAPRRPAAAPEVERRQPLPPNGVPPAGPDGVPSARGRGGPGGWGGLSQDLKLVAQFDKDGDRRLNAAERKAAREFLAKEKAEGRGPRRPRGPFGRNENQDPPSPGPRLAPADVATFPDAPLYDAKVLRTFFLEFESADWERELTDFYHTDVEVPAKLTVDGRTYQDVGVHFRGASSFFTVGEGRHVRLADRRGREDRQGRPGRSEAHASVAGVKSPGCRFTPLTVCVRLAVNSSWLRVTPASATAITCGPPGPPQGASSGRALSFSRRRGARSAWTRRWP